MESMMESRIRIDGAEGLSGEVLERVKGTLSRSCHFTRHWREIACDYRQGVLTLHGSVPSFYLKQVLQSILKDVPGVERIDNRVDVVSAAGLSSVAVFSFLLLGSPATNRAAWARVRWDALDDGQWLSVARY